MDVTPEHSHSIWQIVVYLGAFAIIAVASGQIAKQFQKFKLPLITGFLVIGLISGPELLGLIGNDALHQLRFLNDIALAFIAFAVGSELYLKELRNRWKSIIYMTISQITVTFLLVTLLVYFISSLIPFMSGMSLAGRIAISMLAGTISVARSPASAIAIINELRARGPFTQTSIGVTVVKDFVVVIFFAVIFTLSKSLIEPDDFKLVFIVQVLSELMLAVGMGFLVGFIIRLILSIKGEMLLKRILILSTGFLVYLMTRSISSVSSEHLNLALHVEPLLICIIGSFFVTNYTVYKEEFIKIVRDTGPYVYIIFFTLTGAMISLDVLASLWLITLIIFATRIVSLIVAGYVGSSLAGDSPLFRKVSWMPYVTQAGVSVGLATIIATEYTGWGPQFATIMISVIVLNQIVGPPIFRWALQIVNEVHVRSDGSIDNEQKALIFGWENQSLALAAQLKNHNWSVEFVVVDPSIEILANKDYHVHQLTATDHITLRKLGVETADSLVCMLSDEENLKICETAYEYFGTRHLIVRLQDRSFYKNFHALGAMVLDPTTAMVSLLEHFVRAPIATSLLLGMEETQDSIDIEIRNSNYHGLTLRDLRLPSDIIILSVTRGEHPIISHGYTRLRLGDIVTMVGSPESLDQVRLNLQGY